MLPLRLMSRKRSEIRVPPWLAVVMTFVLLPSMESEMSTAIGTVVERTGGGGSDRPCGTPTLIFPPTR
jgi:hypothetical protein